MSITIKRIYDPPDRQDGIRILVDRLWPRGISRGSARIDEWIREIAPSPELRTWFGHRPERFAEFRRRYLRELAGRPELVEHLRRAARTSSVTLLFAAYDPVHNNAAVLQSLVRGTRTARRRRTAARSPREQSPGARRGARA